MVPPMTFYLLLQAIFDKKEIPWGCPTAKSTYSAIGSRDVLILAPDLSLPHPEAVPRRPGQLTQEDKIKLLRQGVPPNSCKNEANTIKARYELDKRDKMIEVKSGKSLSQKEVLENIAHHLNTTQNDGGKKT